MQEQIEPPNPLPADMARAWMKSLGFWYQRLYLGNGVWTHDDGPAYHELVWDKFQPALPKTFSGLSVLDVGCNAGYFTLQSKLRGAKKVVGTDFISSFIEQAKGAAKVWGVNIDYHLIDVHNIQYLVPGKFDIVWFCGILYHLENLQVLRMVGNMCTDAILVETEFIPDNPRNCLVVRHSAAARSMR
jgi:tRNA (mo5U34)-methyltransferase